MWVSKGRFSCAIPSRPAGLPPVDCSPILLLKPFGYSAPHSSAGGTFRPRSRKASSCCPPFRYKPWMRSFALRTHRSSHVPNSHSTAARRYGLISACEAPLVGTAVTGAVACVAPAKPHIEAASARRIGGLGIGSCIRSLSGMSSFSLVIFSGRLGHARYTGPADTTDRS